MLRTRWRPNLETPNPPFTTPNPPDSTGQRHSLPICGLLACTLLIGCCPPATTNPLTVRVGLALEGQADAALLYAGLYNVLADRLDDRAYATTDEFAAVAARAAVVLRSPEIAG